MCPLEREIVDPARLAQAPWLSAALGLAALVALVALPNPIDAASTTGSVNGDGQIAR